MKTNKEKVAKIKDNVEKGYTMARYGNSTNLHNAMRRDINTLLSIVNSNKIYYVNGKSGYDIIRTCKYKEDAEAFLKKENKDDDYYRIDVGKFDIIKF